MQQQKPEEIVNIDITVRECEMLIDLLDNIKETKTPNPNTGTFDANISIKWETYYRLQAINNYIARCQTNS